METSVGISYQVFADIDYAPDEAAFLSIDVDKTLEVFANLPQCPVKD